MSGKDLLLLGGSFGVAQYKIERSLRFNSADSAYLSKTFGTSGNRKTWTLSLWMKKSTNGSVINFAGSTNSGGTTGTEFYFNGDALVFDEYVSSSQTFRLTTSQLFRDNSAWYHIIFAVDTTQATASNRIKIYVNGSQVTAFSTATYPSQNLDTQFNYSSLAMGIGQNGAYASGLFNGYMAEINFIDGQQLTASSFGQTNSTTGVWEPKQFTGTYGTNGFFLQFADNSGTTSTTLGKDTSGNGNNWTPNNFSVTAGAGNDSLVDTPTPYGTDTGAGGEVRGNYCTWNPLDLTPASGTSTYSNGNLEVTTLTGNYGIARSTIYVSSGKWYWEIVPSQTEVTIGIVDVTQRPTYAGGSSLSYAYYGGSGAKVNNGSYTSYGASYGNGNVIGVALDLDAGTLVFYKNGVSQGTAFSSLSGTFCAAISDVDSGTNATLITNFGQRAFAYTAPSGFKALNTQNLPTPTVVQGDDYFNTVLWTGNGASSRAITGVGFQPDWVWDKMRSDAYQHAIVDSVRGGNKVLHSNSTAAEDVNWQYGYVSSFDSDGFTIQAGSTSAENWNLNGATFVAWNWKANGSGSSNTAGSISSTVSANTTSGFSIVTYTGTGSNATVGHGLGATPSMIIAKSRSNAVAWVVYHISLGGSQEVYLNNTDAAASSANWNGAPTSTVINLKTDTNANGNGYTYVAYCFAPVAGFSAFGSYTGNGSSDGPFVYTGFRPRWVLFKRTNATNDWFILDTARDTYNALTAYLSPDLSNAEATASNIADFVSNGFKVRGTSTYYGFNGSGDTYIYAAFAENPFKYALAR
jgi:hypothetical protein